MDPKDKLTVLNSPKKVIIIMFALGCALFLLFVLAASLGQSRFKKPAPTAQQIENLEMLKQVKKNDFVICITGEPPRTSVQHAVFVLNNNSATLYGYEFSILSVNSTGTSGIYYNKFTDCKVRVLRGKEISRELIGSIILPDDRQY